MFVFATIVCALAYKLGAYRRNVWGACDYAGGAGGGNVRACDENDDDDECRLHLNVLCVKQLPVDLCLCS